LYKKVLYVISIALVPEFPSVRSPQIDLTFHKKVAQSQFTPNPVASVLRNEFLPDLSPNDIPLLLEFENYLDGSFDPDSGFDKFEFISNNFLWNFNYKQPLWQIFHHSLNDFSHIMSDLCLF
jgi:hypothetical protein